MNVTYLSYHFRMIQQRYSLFWAVSVLFSYFRVILSRLWSVCVLVLMVAFLNGESLIWCVYQFEREDLAINYCQTDDLLGAIDESAAFHYVCCLIDGKNTNTDTRHTPSLNLHDTRTLPPTLSYLLREPRSVLSLSHYPPQSLAKGYTLDLLRPPRA